VCVLQAEAPADPHSDCVVGMHLQTLACTINAACAASCAFNCRLERLQTLTAASKHQLPCALLHTGCLAAALTVSLTPLHVVFVLQAGAPADPHHAACGNWVMHSPTLVCTTNVVRAASCGCPAGWSACKPLQLSALAFCLLQLCAWAALLLLSHPASLCLSCRLERLQTLITLHVAIVCVRHSWLPSLVLVFVLQAGAPADAHSCQLALAQAAASPQPQCPSALPHVC
jgi:hypothetical protein